MRPKKTLDLTDPRQLLAAGRFIALRDVAEHLPQPGAKATSAAKVVRSRLEDEERAFRKLIARDLERAGYDPERCTVARVLVAHDPDAPLRAWLEWEQIDPNQGRDTSLLLPIYVETFDAPEYVSAFRAEAPDGDELLVVPVPFGVATALMNLVVWIELAVDDLARLKVASAPPRVRWQLLTDAITRMRDAVQARGQTELRLAALINPLRAEARDTLDRLLTNPAIAAPALLAVLVNVIEQWVEQAKAASPNPGKRLDLTIEFAKGTVSLLQQHAYAYARDALRSAAPRISNEAVSWTSND